MVNDGLAEAVTLMIIVHCFCIFGWSFFVILEGRKENNNIQTKTTYKSSCENKINLDQNGSGRLLYANRTGTNMTIIYVAFKWQENSKIAK